MFFQPKKANSENYFPITKNTAIAREIINILQEQ